MAKSKGQKKYKRTKLPKATKKVDDKQNKVIQNLSKRVDDLDKENEVKCWIFYDNFAYGSTYSTTLTQANPVNLLLNGMVRGTQIYGRVGDRVKNTSVRVNGTIYPSGGIGIGIDAMFRIMIVRFKNPQGRNLQLAGNATSATLGPPLFFNVPGNPLWPQQTYNNGVDTQGAPMDEYDVIYDKKYMLTNKVGTTYYNAGAVNQAVNPSINFDIKKKLGFITQQNLGNGGTYADFFKNSLFFLVFTETNSNCTIKLNTHLYFKDS